MLTTPDGDRNYPCSPLLLTASQLKLLDSEEQAKLVNWVRMCVEKNREGCKSGWDWILGKDFAEFSRLIDKAKGRLIEK